MFEAWADKDPKAVSLCFDENAIYYASIGDGPGEKAVGRSAIRKLVAKLMKFDDGASVDLVEVITTNDRAIFTWTYTFEDSSKEFGCDIFEVQRGKITTKDAYRKSRVPTGVISVSELKE